MTPDLFIVGSNALSTIALGTLCYYKKNHTQDVVAKQAYGWLGALILVAGVWGLGVTYGLYRRSLIGRVTLLDG